MVPENTSNSQTLYFGRRSLAYGEKVLLLDLDSLEGRRPALHLRLSINPPDPLWPSNNGQC